MAVCVEHGDIAASCYFWITVNQVPVAAVLFLILFTGNSFTTWVVVRQKINLKDFFLRKLQ